MAKFIVFLTQIEMCLASGAWRCQFIDDYVAKEVSAVKVRMGYYSTSTEFNDAGRLIDLGGKLRDVADIRIPAQCSNGV